MDKVGSSQDNSGAGNQNSNNSQIQFGTIGTQDRKENDLEKIQGPTDNSKKAHLNQGRKENQVSVTAKEENLDSYVTHFCGSAAPEQGFFHIEDTPCEQNGKDTSTLAIVEVIKGTVLAKQIEGEFKTMAGEGSTWRWYAKKIADKKYQMRFPTAYALHTATHFHKVSLRSDPSDTIKIYGSGMQKWVPRASSQMHGSVSKESH